MEFFNRIKYVWILEDIREKTRTRNQEQILNINLNLQGNVPGKKNYKLNR